MIAAVYARKSTSQTGVADNTKSVARQVEHAKAYAARKGWAVDDEHVYVDDGISGAEFANRPGFVRLMNALKPVPTFQMLIMSEESRLGREIIETSYALKQIVQAGVRVFYYMEDRERTLDSPTDKVLMAVNAYAGELEREMASQRSRDAALQRAKSGHVAGGACYGYLNVRGSGGVVREVDEAQAVVVRRIFTLCSDGKGARRIAKQLNAEGAPAPRPQQGRPQGWAPSSVRAILYRPLYRGEIVWGKVQKRNAWGQVRYQRRDENEWHRASVPSLRIVDDSLWEAAHERLRTSRQNYLRHTDGRLWGRPTNGVESKYLLTGMAICGNCGAGMLIRSRSHGRRRQLFYGCAANYLRGDQVCSNDLEIRMEMADKAILDVVEQELLSPDVVSLALEKLIARVNAPDGDEDARRAQLTKALETVDQELARFKSAIAAGGELATLLEGITEREARRHQLRDELDALEATPAIREAATSVRVDLLRHVDEWRGLLGQHVSTSRQLLRKLLDGRIVFSPKHEGEDRWYDLVGQATVAKVLAGLPALKAVASPTGFEPVS